MAAPRYPHHGVVWRAAGSDAMVPDYDVLLSWAPCIAEFSIVAVKIYEHRQLLWVAMPSWAQLRAQPEAWTLAGLQLWRLRAYTYWMREFYDWCAAWSFVLLLCSWPHSE